MVNKLKKAQWLKTANCTFNKKIRWFNTTKQHLRQKEKN